MLTASYLGDRKIAVLPAEPNPPGPGQVQVEVAYTGICGTDRHVLHGDMDGRVSPPAILGHEMSGVVAALGDGVAGWAVGDQVTVVPLTWDGTCPACRAGHEHVCQNLLAAGSTCQVPCSNGGTYAPVSSSPCRRTYGWTMLRSLNRPRSPSTTCAGPSWSPAIVPSCSAAARSEC